MATAYLGSIILFAGNFAPKGTAFCNGQMMSIASNSALFALLGTTYGGNGQTTFALPDLRGRVPLHSGGSQGPGLSFYPLGMQTGAETVTLNTQQMPAHTHVANASSSAADAVSPTNNFWSAAPGASARGGGANVFASAANTAMNPTALSPSGSSQPHSNIQPILALNYIIYTQGFYPSRN